MRAVDRDPAATDTMNMVFPAPSHAGQSAGNRADPNRWGSSHPGGRYGTHPGWRARLLSAAGTAAVMVTPLLGTLVTWTTAAPVAPAPTAPIVVELLPLAAPPEPVSDLPEGPAEPEQQAAPVRQSKPEPVETVTRILPVIPAPASAPVPEPQTPPAAEPIPQSTAPRSIPAPPAPRAASNTERTWEALLLAHLERHRRYPASARARQIQGVAHLRFRMNRSGKVLGATVLRSSGAAVLDRAALDTLKRAQPLPAIPKERADEVELTLPVEFYVPR